MGAEQPSTTSITLHSTWRFLIGSAIGAGAVATAGTYGVYTAGFNVITTVIFVAGWIFVAVVVLDLPVASRFSSAGVLRRMLLRRQFLAWQPSDSLVRAPSVVRQEARSSQGGLVLRRGRRKYLLADKAESADEFAAVLDLVDTSGSPGAAVDLSSLPAPPSSSTPTWLYRRRRWRPDGALGR